MFDLKFVYNLHYIFGTLLENNISNAEAEKQTSRHNPKTIYYEDKDTFIISSAYDGFNC